MWYTVKKQHKPFPKDFLWGASTSAYQCEGVANIQKELYQQNHHMMLAQARAMAFCHEMVPGAKIGPVPNISAVYPASCKPEDITAAGLFSAIRNWFYLDMAVHGVYNHQVWHFLEEQDALPEIQPGDMEILASGHPDFIAFNYYSTATAAMDDSTEEADPAVFDQQRAASWPGLYRSVKNPNLPVTQWGWEIDPVGFRNTLNEVYSRYRLPILITENGLGAYDKLEPDGTVQDDYRIEYLQKHIEQMQLAIDDGVEMLGYCPWSAIDLISTHEGFEKRYGFIYINRDNFDLKDMARIRKKSFFWYKKVIAANGADLSN